MPHHLEEVFQLYEVPDDQRDEIVRYAFQHPGVARSILLAVPELEKVFGKTRRRLELFQFEDGGGDEELLRIVVMKSEPEADLALLEQFEQAFFSKVPQEVHLHLNFDIMTEDDYTV